jgi:hypothetical protein
LWETGRGRTITSPINKQGRRKQACEVRPKSIRFFVR